MPASDLVSPAARFFVLAEQASRLDDFSYRYFWDLSAPPVVETASHLPAMAAAVRTAAPLWQDILWKVTRHPLPGVLPPEAVPWHNQLVAAWEIHRTSGHAELQNLARRALVRLDGCGMPDGHVRSSRLPEWLAEAQKITSGRSDRPVARTGEGQPDGRTYSELETLAALAAWRTAPRVLTPPETLRAWVAFWMKRRRSKNTVEKGLAAIALLNLPEADLRAASIPPMPAGELLRQLSEAIQVAADRTCKEYKDYLSLLDWQPVKEPTWPVAQIRRVAQTWLKVTRHEYWMCRRTAWRQLIRWGRAGSLALCGINLVPELVKAIPTEKNGEVLWELARWALGLKHFTAAGVPDGRSQLQQLEKAWELYSVSWNPGYRVYGWMGRTCLHQAGLASEPPESFLEACLSAMADERDNVVLFILAQWSPDTKVPERWHRDRLAAWQQRLLDKDADIQQTAAWALLRQALKKEPGRSLRCAALELWRAGTKASSKVKDTLSAVPSRLQEVQARLAAGEVPDFEKVPVPPAERHRPPRALPPGHIAAREWQMENEKLKMENEEWKMKHQEVTTKANHPLVPDRPSR